MENLLQQNLERTKEEKCKNCKFLHRLKYNFQKSIGFQEGYCCDMLLRTEEPDGVIDCEPWVQEVTLDSMCEMFTPKGV